MCCSLINHRTIKIYIQKKKLESRIQTNKTDAALVISTTCKTVNVERRMYCCKDRSSINKHYLGFRSRYIFLLHVHVPRLERNYRTTGTCTRNVFWCHEPGERWCEIRIRWRPNSLHSRIIMHFNFYNMQQTVSC